MRITPKKIEELKDNEIFVFGSNEAGVHGAGAAKLAMDSFGAKYGKGFGLSGKTFAIPTKDTKIQTLPLESIEEYVATFIVLSRSYTDKIFLVTEIGCGLAGYSPKDIAPFFREAINLPNIFLPQSFIDELNKRKFIQTYKMTDKDMKCRDFKFELGVRYDFDGDIKVCSSGFHSCLLPINCLKYYNNDGSNKLFLCEVEILGNEDFEGGDNIYESEKLCSSNIRLIKDVSHKISELFNSGNRNSGNRNSGDWNSGNWNSGNRNSGDWNSGNWNSGDWNSGNWNSGNWNSGNWNSGDGNSGNWNSGNWNSGDGKNRFFCSDETPNYFFNKISDKKQSDVYFPSWLYFELNEWVYASEMTEEEKEENEYYEIYGGYLKTYSYKEAAKKSYDSATKSEQDAIQNIPNYCPEILFEIFGIDRR